MMEPPPGEGGGSPGCGLSVVLSTAGKDRKFCSSTGGRRQC